MPCHWDPPEPTIEEEAELGHIDITRYLARRTTPMTTYRERLKAGHHDASKATPSEDPDPDNLPGRHAALDELATARGVVFAVDKLTIEQKQAQIRESLTS